MNVLRRTRNDPSHNISVFGFLLYPSAFVEFHLRLERANADIKSGHMINYLIITWIGSFY